MIKAYSVPERGQYPELAAAHILVVRTDRLGDMVLTLPLFQAVKQAFPHTHLSVLASQANADIARMCPNVDEVRVDTVEARESRYKDTLGLARRLRAWGPDVVLFGNAKQRLALAAWMARIPIRVGSIRRRYSVLYTHRIPLLPGQPYEHEVDRTLRLLQPLGITPITNVPRVPAVPEKTRSTVLALLHEHGIGDDAAIAVVHPGNSGNALTASAPWYASLADALVADGYDVVLTGTTAEQSQNSAVVDAAQNKLTDFTGKLSVAQLAALYTRSAVCIASSTGTTHLSAALDAPTIALYMPLVKQDQWLPRGQRVVVLQPDVGMTCAACLGPKCGYFNCMDHVSIDTVVAAAREFKV